MLFTKNGIIVNTKIEPNGKGHLYFVLNGEIKNHDELIKGAWYINTFREYNKPFKNENLDNNGYLRQIIATTDTKLRVVSLNHFGALPQPSQSFIEKYCKLGGIDEVDVEYETIHADRAPNGFETLLKVNSHNEIAIHSIKNNWNTKEVITLLQKYADSTSDGKCRLNEVNHWVKKNL